MANKISWFKLLWLNSEERNALKKGLEKEEDVPVGNTPILQALNGIKTVLKSNGIVTVIMRNGTVYSKQGDQALMAAVMGTTSPEEVEMLMREVPKVEQTVSLQEKNLVSDNLGIFKNHKDFTVQDKNVYMNGVNLAIPPVIVSTFIEILEKQKAGAQDLEEEYQALRTFWLKLALNALPQSREDLLTFVKNNDVRITPNGNLVLYRRIVKIGSDNKDLVAFISQNYFRVKKWKKSPKNYVVMESPTEGGTSYGLALATDIIGVQLEDDEAVLGTLDELYHNLGDVEENKFTSYHKQGVHTIRVGAIYQIPDKDINLDNGLCAAGGLHAASVNYDYSSFGDTPVVVLVNPSKAITVPTGETGKLRTTEMFVACVNDKPHGVHFDDDNLTAFDDEYHELTVQQLELALQNKSFTTLAVEDKVPEISIKSMYDITEMLRNRIKTIA